MVDEIIYNGTKGCPDCGRPINPVLALFAGPSGLCPQCRDRAQMSNLKNRMAGPDKVRTNNDRDLARGNGY